MKSALTVLVLGFLTFSVALKSVLAVTVSGSIGVSAMVPATCLASASSLKVGTHSGAALNATTNVSMNCSDATPYDVSLDAGRAPSAVAASQKMSALGLVLDGYVFAPNTGGNVTPVRGVEIDTVAGTGNGAPQTIVLRGQISGGHSIVAGIYPDSITVTVTY